MTLKFKINQFGQVIRKSLMGLLLLSPPATARSIRTNSGLNDSGNP